MHLRPLVLRISNQMIKLIEKLLVLYFFIKRELKFVKVPVELTRSFLG